MPLDDLSVIAESSTGQHDGDPASIPRARSLRLKQYRLTAQLGVRSDSAIFVRPRMKALARALTDGDKKFLDLSNLLVPLGTEAAHLTSAAFSVCFHPQYDGDLLYLYASEPAGEPAIFHHRQFSANHRSVIRSDRRTTGSATVEATHVIDRGSTQTMPEHSIGPDGVHRSGDEWQRR